MPERDEAGDRACGYRSDDRDHLKDAGHESEEQHERHLQDRETNERHRRHHADEEHLTADVSAKERIHLPDERDELVPLASGQHSTEPLEETRRVAQQEERRDEEHKELKKEMAAAAVRGRDIRRSRAPTNGSNTNAKTPAQTKGRTMSPARYTM